MTALIDLSDERLRRDAERVYGLGPRVFLEFLLELARDRLLRTDIEQRLDRYAKLDPSAVAALGADRFPPRGDR